MEPFFVKQIAKEINLLRYLPELKVYEISITWQADYLNSPSLYYLPEIFLYPYAIRKDKKTIIVKAAEVSISSDTSLQDVHENNKNTLPSLGSDQLIKGEISQSENLVAHTNLSTSLKEVGSILNYDSALNRDGIKGSLRQRNKDVLKFKEKNLCSKKRKV